MTDDEFNRRFGDLPGHTAWFALILFVLSLFLFLTLTAVDAAEAENADCIPCNTSVFDLRYHGQTLHEFDTEEDCEAAIEIAKAWPGLSCVEVYVQRYEG